jgi:cell division protein FtsQ
MIGENGHPLLEPDRHYFRRGLNRRVHKARRARTALRWAGIVLSNVVVAGGVLLVGARTLRVLVISEEFAVRTIHVEGTTKTTPEAVAAALRPMMGQSLVELDLAEAARLAGSDRWVRDASVKRVFPDTLRVKVRERRPAALAVVGGLVQVVDEDGVPMGPAGRGLAYDLPVLTGLERLEGAALAATLERGVTVLKRLSAASPALSSEISEVDLSEPDRVVAVPSGAGPRLLLDPGAVERNIPDWLALRTDVTRRTGPLEYADLRWDRRIALKPRDELLINKSE